MNAIQIILTVNILLDTISICLLCANNPKKAWHFQTPAENRSQSIKSSWLDEGETREHGWGKWKEKKGEDRCDSHWVFLYRPLRRSRWGVEVEKRAGIKKRAAESLLWVFNLNPKSTGLLKHKRLGSSSAFCHFRNMCNISATAASILCLVTLPGVKCFFFLPTLKCSCLGYYIRLSIQ